VSQTDTGIKAILGNPVLIKAYREGIPGKGKHFPEGSAIVKIECHQKRTLLEIGFIHREEFQEISGYQWTGLCPVLYDAGAGTSTPYGDDSSFGKKVCCQCHTRVAGRDYIFTDYPLR
jgi:hypothetical protein